MKKFFHTIYRYKIALIAALLLAIGGGIFFFGGSGRHDDFAQAYRAYSSASEAHVFTASVPSREDNPIRARLLKLLSFVLSDSGLTDEDRLEYAREGITLIDEAEHQIDQIGTYALPLGDALRTLEGAADRVWGTGREEAQQIAALAATRAEDVSDIRGLSYSANAHIETIFRRILKDNGALTAEHVIDLNNQLPAAEKAFDDRSNLYEEILGIQDEMDDLYASFEEGN